MDRSGLYLAFLPLVLSGRAELLDNQRLFSELRSLQRRTRSGRRDRVDHPPRMQDDLANAGAGVCSLLVVGKSYTGVLGYYKMLMHEEEAKKPPLKSKTRNRKKARSPSGAPGPIYLEIERRKWQWQN